MRVLLLCLLYMTVDAQSLGIHHSFTEQANTLNFSIPDWGSEPPCPWQSVRLLGNTHVQIDVRGDLESIQSIDLGMVIRDLWRLYKGYGRSSLEVVRQGGAWKSEGSSVFTVDRNYKVRIHTSWPYPFEDTTKWLDDQWVAYTLPCNNCGDWFIYELPNGMLYAQKQVGEDEYIASFVQFLSINSTARGFMIPDTSNRFSRW